MFIVSKINISFLYQSSVMVVSEVAFRFFLIRECLFCRQIDNHRQLNMRFWELTNLSRFEKSGRYLCIGIYKRPTLDEHFAPPKMNTSFLRIRTGFWGCCFCEVGFLFFQICYLIHCFKKFQVEPVQSLVIEKTNHF